VSRDWNKFVESLNSVVEKNPDRNEEETKAKLIAPVLRRMGWDFFGDEVALEYPVSFATSTSKVDYALKQNERPVVFVEAKSLKGDITYKNVKQALDYSTHEDVRWCVVTNGQEWRIFDADKYKKEKSEIEPKDARVEIIKLENLSNRKDAIEIISRKSLESGDTAKRVQSIWQTRTTIENFESEKEKLKEKITEVLKEQSGDLLEEKLESMAGQFVNDVINELEDFVQEEEQKKEIEKTKEAKKEKEPYELDPEKLERGSEHDLAHAKIDKAHLGSKTDIARWRDFIREAVILVVKNGKKDFVLDKIPSAQEGLADSDEPRYSIEEANVSLTPDDANHCILYTYILAREMNLEFMVKFHWRDKEGAIHPGEILP